MRNKKLKNKVRDLDDDTKFTSLSSSFPSEEEDEDENDDDDDDDEEEEVDDGHPWFGCVCGRTHDTFWIQCEQCNSWYNNSPRCVGYGEREAQRGAWQCPNCSSHAHAHAHAHGGSKSNNNGDHDEEVSSSSTTSASSGIINSHSSSSSSSSRKDTNNKSDINRDDGLGKTPHVIHTPDLKSLDNKTLLGPLYVLTERSVTVISRLVTYFLQNTGVRGRTKTKSTNNFNTDLWAFVWNCLRYEQKLKGWELGWNCQLHNQTCGRKHYYIPRKSPQSKDRREGFDYFTSSEAVVAHLCIAIRNIDENAFDSIGDDIIDKFVIRLSRTTTTTTTTTTTMREQREGQCEHSSSTPSVRSRSLKRGYFQSISQYEKDLFGIHAKRQKYTHYGAATTSMKGGTCERIGISNSNSNKLTNDVDIIRLNQELLNAIANNDVKKCSSLCTKDTLSYEQNDSTPDYEEERGGLVRGLPLPNSSQTTCTNTSTSESSSEGDDKQKQQHKKIFMTNQFVEWQGDLNETAVLSYTRHDIDGGLINKRKELRIWTKKNGSWANTLTCTFSVPSCMV